MKKDKTIYKKTVLDSGLTIINECIPYVRSISLGFWIKTGSRKETEKNNGISHFLEHMVFRGTKKRKGYEIAESLESLGGSINAYTGKETTCFFAHFVDEYLPLAVDVLADIIQNPLLDESDIKKEKNVIIEEINGIKDDAEELVYEYFQNKIFNGNSLGYPVIGTIENVKNLTREDLVDYLQKNYTVNNIVIAASGNINHDRLVELVEKHINLPQSDNTNEYPFPQKADVNISQYNKEVTQSHLCTGFRSISYSDDLKFALLILNTFFGNGMSSRLFQNIREKYGFTYSIYSFLDFYSDIGDFGVYVASDKKKLNETMNLIIDEYSRLEKKDFSEAEIERSKSQLKGNVILGLENTASRMFRLGKMEIYTKNYTSLDEVLKKIDEVDLNQVHKTIEKIIDIDNIYSVILKPE